MGKINFFSYDSESGFEGHETAEAAKEAAQKSIDVFRENAEEGWPEEVSSVCWGEIRQVALEEECGPKDGGWDYYSEYALSAESSDTDDECVGPDRICPFCGQDSCGCDMLAHLNYQSRLTED